MPTQETIDREFIQQSIRMAIENVKQQQGGPFAAIIVKNNEIIATGTNVVTTTDDPTAHAEISAIRAACKKLHTFELDDCTIYSSCEPCPMCLGAIYWAHLSRLVFAAGKKQAADAGFDDDFIYKEFELPYNKRKLITSQTLSNEGELPFEEWRNNDLKITY